MVVTVDDLERAGLAERVPSKSDRRARIVRVTPAGTRVVRKGQQVVADIQEDVLASLPESDRTALIGALENLVEGRLSTPTPCSRAPRRRV
jgi:MarR family transcriptional regulator, transcriptional regulator for hemolysin